MTGVRWEIIEQPGLSPGGEPVLWTEAVRVVILLAISFGLDLTGEQVGLIMTLVGIVAAFIARGRVSPVRPS
jgi:hypothetical protein